MGPRAVDSLPCMYSGGNLKSEKHLEGPRAWILSQNPLKAEPRLLPECHRQHHRKGPVQGPAQGWPVQAPVFLAPALLRAVLCPEALNPEGASEVSAQHRARQPNAMGGQARGTAPVRKGG